MEKGVAPFFMVILPKKIDFLFFYLLLGVESWFSSLHVRRFLFILAFV
jgi:hypothetical protein